MIFLYILLGIIALFVIVLSIRFKIHFEYDETVSCYAKWLFIKIPIFPGKEKKNGKDEQTTVETPSSAESDNPLNEDTEESADYRFDSGESAVDTPLETVPAEIIPDITSEADSGGGKVIPPKTAEESKQETAENISEEPVREKEEPAQNEEEPAKEKEEPAQNNPEQSAESTPVTNKRKPEKNSITDIKGIFTTYYENTGIDGVIELLGRLFTALDNYSRRAVHWFVTDELYVNAVIAEDDAAKTAYYYGKYCGIIFPLFGNLIARFNVKKYDIDISPDYLAKKGNASLVFTMSIIPRKLINSTVILVSDMIFKFLLKLLKHGRVRENTDNNTD